MQRSWQWFLLSLFGASLVALFSLAACDATLTPSANNLSAAPRSQESTPPSTPEGTLENDFPAPQSPRGNRIRLANFSVDDGLSQSVANAILQDSRGFLWIGTEDGLNRFDGYGFTVYRHDPEDPDSLSDSHISSLVEGDSGALWVGTYGGGLNLFEPETGKWRHYRHDPTDPNSLSDDRVQVIHRDRQGQLWIGTRGGGLDKFDPASGAWHHHRHNASDSESLSNDSVYAILEDSSARLWIATDGGLSRYDPETDHFTRFLPDPGDAASLTSGIVRALYQDSMGVLWIGTAAGGLYRYEPETQSFLRYQIAARDPSGMGVGAVLAIQEDLSGTLWIGTEGGLERYDRLTGRFTHFRYDPSDPDSPRGGAVHAIYRDRSGILWIGIYGGGLNRYDPETQQFAHFAAEPGDPNSLSENMVWAIHQDRSGVLWVGTHGGGLNRFDWRTGQWRHFRHDPDDANSLSSDQVTEIYEDRSGMLWLGTGGDGLNQFDPQTEQFTHFRADPDDADSLSGNHVWEMLQDRTGKLWIGTTSGLNRLDLETKEFTRFRNDPDDPHSLSDDVVGPLLEDPSGSLWVGTQKGLNRLDPETGRVQRFQNTAGDPSSLSNNSLLAIHQDPSGVLWLGTWGGGLNRFDPAEGTFTHYRVKDGLPNDVVYGILEEDQGALWLSTNNGLSRFDPRTEAFRNFGVADGLQSPEFNYNAYSRSTAGEMFFGGINGFNAFYPDQIRDNPYVPPVVLTSLTHEGEPMEHVSALPTLTQTTLVWPATGFEFEFAALSYALPGDNEYAYRLEGFDDDWNYVGTRRFGAYTNLPGGTYTLGLRGSSRDGVWNEEGRSLTITVVPPFWATWWFRGLVALALVAAVAGSYRLRVRSVEARSRELEQQVTSRTRELAALNTIASVVSRLQDPEQIMDDALGKTLEVTGFEAGGIYLFSKEAAHRDPRILSIAAQRGLSAELANSMDNLVVGEGFSGRVVETGEPLVVKDLPSDPRLTRSMVAESGFRAVAISPIISRGGVLGTLFVITRESADVSQQDVELLTAIAGQIGIAIENANFFEAEKRSAEQFRLIAEVARRVALILDVDEVLQQVVTLVQQTFAYYHVAIGLVEGNEVVYRAGAGSLWGASHAEFQPSRLKLGTEGTTGWVASSGETLLVPDVGREPRYIHMEGSETRSELTIPIAVAGQVIGVLDVQSDRPNAFDETDVTVLQSLAHQAGAAIENARLYEQAQHAAVMEERSRLARDLHDAVTQTLFSASLIAEAVPSAWELDQQEGRQLLRELRQLTRGALAEMRTLLMELRPATVVEASLDDLLSQLAEAASGRMGVPVSLRVQGVCALPRDVHIAFYRIAQEALNNTVKHARASQVTLELLCPPETPAPGEVQARQQVELRITDDGQGFVPENVPADHLGLGIMGERAEAIGAQFVIESSPGRGTRLRLIWWPPA